MVGMTITAVMIVTAVTAVIALNLTKTSTLMSYPQI
jgi:hypothetical protein